MTMNELPCGRVWSSWADSTWVVEHVQRCAVCRKATEEEKEEGEG